MGKASKTGVILLGIIAVNLFLSGPFVMDPWVLSKGLKVYTEWFTVFSDELHLFSWR